MGRFHCEIAECCGGVDASGLASTVPDRPEAQRVSRQEMPVAPVPVQRPARQADSSARYLKDVARRIVGLIFVQDPVRRSKPEEEAHVDAGDSGNGDAGAVVGILVEWPGHRERA